MFNCALSNKRGTSSFYLNTHITSSSLLEMKDLHKKAFPKSYGEKKISVKLNTINNLIHRKFLLNNKVFLKIDVQGSELDVLLGSSKILDLIDIILIEVSYIKLYKKQKLFHDLYIFFIKNNFKYFGNVSQIIDKNTGMNLQANAIFLNEKKN